MKQQFRFSIMLLALLLPALATAHDFEVDGNTGFPKEFCDNSVAIPIR